MKQLLFILCPFFFIILFFSSCKKDSIEYNGHTYKTVTIGSQTWFAENLQTTKYNDGTDIPNVTDAKEWSELSTPAYCWYENDYETYGKYGALYNAWVFDEDKNGGKNICPEGWRVPTEEDWNILIEYLGGKEVAGGKMKSTELWDEPNKGATNESGFNALPSGTRVFFNGAFQHNGSSINLWMQKIQGANAFGKNLNNESEEANFFGLSAKSGHCIRCIKK